MAPGAGEKLDRFVVLSRLGEGKNGEVYLAEDATLQRRIAIKILRATSAEGRAALVRQAKVAATIVHPNAIQIFEVGSSGGHAFVAMELAGRSLAAIVREGKASVLERATWLVDAARAVAAGHEQRVVHRNLSLENVLVRDDGVVKVTDFGLDATDTGVRFDANAETVATPLDTMKSGDQGIERAKLASPEELRGLARDAKSDVFTWGVVAYEALAGRSPWRSLDVAGAVEEVLATTPPRADAIDPRIPSEIAAVIARAMEKSRDDRFASMSEAADALAAAIAGARPKASPSEQSVVAPIVVAIALILAAAGSGLVLLSKARARDGKPASSSSSSAAHATLESEPEPTSAVPEALALYRAGVQGIHDGADRAAIANFVRASELDPQFAAAHLRAAIYWTVPDDGDREHLRKATELRASLSPRDRALRDAFEPWLTVPQDAAEAERRLAKAAQERPNDTDVAYNLCHIRETLGRYTQALPACESVLRVDPTFAGAWRYEGVALGFLDRTDDALHAFERCLQLSPQATSCDMDLYFIQADRGACSDALATARREIAVDPASSDAYEHLANALYSSGASVESVRAALDQRARNVVEVERAQDTLEEQVNFDLARGRFEDALRTLDTLAREVRLRAEEEPHMNELAFRLAIDRELGRDDDVERSVKRYFGERAAWIPQTSGVEPTIRAYDGLYLAGRMSRADFVREREAWLVRDRARSTRGGLFGQPLALEWWLAFARPIRSRDDAAEALAALPDYLPTLASIIRRTDYQADVGDAYALAGRAAEAEEWLRRATRACWALIAPIDTVRVHASLGRVLETKGDRDGACAEYAWVLAHWPARTRARSSLSAAAGMQRLACP